ncbi:hypothetical protein ACJMK2_024564 [Sinanodonta woodiana]|uniref:C2H2-type domain-containing protein n=1 Tax=Sinanodonta woodiana TaxID=1069815 RepID=A0ABD3XHK3_SINWO
MSATERSSGKDQLDILVSLEALQSLEDVSLIKQRLKTMCQALSRRKGITESLSGVSAVDVSEAILQTPSSTLTKHNMSSLSQQENDFNNLGTSMPTFTTNINVNTDDHEQCMAEMNSDSHKQCIAEMNSDSHEQCMAEMNSDSHEQCMAEMNSDSHEQCMAEMNSDSHEQCIAEMNSDSHKQNSDNHEQCMAEMNSDSHKQCMAEMNSDSHEQCMAEMNSDSHEQCMAEMNSDSHEQCMAEMNSDCHKQCIAEMNSDSHKQNSDNHEQCMAEMNSDGHKQNSDNHEQYMAEMNSDGHKQCMAEMNIDGHKQCMAEMNIDGHKQCMAEMNSDGHKQCMAEMNSDNHKQCMAEMNSDSHEQCMAEMNSDSHKQCMAEMNSDSHEQCMAEMNSYLITLDKEEQIGSGVREENSKNTTDEDIISDPVDNDKEYSFSSVKLMINMVNEKPSKIEKESFIVSTDAIDCVILPAVLNSGKPNSTGSKGKPTVSRKQETFAANSHRKKNRSSDKVLDDMDNNSEKSKSNVVFISNPDSKKGLNEQLRNKSIVTMSATTKEDQSIQNLHDKLQNQTATDCNELESSVRKRPSRQRKKKIYTDFFMEIFPEKAKTVCKDIKPKSLEKIFKKSKSMKQIKQNPDASKPSVCKPFPKCEKTISSQRQEKSANLRNKEAIKEDKKLEITCKKFEEKEVGENKDRQFKCHSCGEVFNNESTLVNHLLIHEPKSDCKIKHQIPLRCTTCKQHFSSLKCLRKHLKKKVPCLSVEERRERYQCKTCGRQFLAHSSLTRHLATHSDERSVPCPKCDKKFKHKENLFKHMKIHQQKPLACSKCLKAFDTLEKQNSHQCRAPFQCSVCLKPFRARLFLKEHEDAVHKGRQLYECKVCSKKLSHMSSLSRHMTLMHSTERPVQCKLCGKTFKVKQILSRHMKFSHSGIEFRCDICGYRCSQPDNFKRHKLRHSSEKPFMCEKCGRSYKSKRQLHVHIYLHTGEAPYQCMYCDKKYASKDTLRQHLIMHENPNSLTCDVCGKLFGQLGHLSRHKKSHFEGENIKCKFCELEFKSVTRMMTHVLRSHAEEAVKTNAVRLLKCEICGKLFVHKKDFESHMNRHTGARPYKCKYCGKDFNDRSNLRQHVRVHEGGRRYKCTVCGKMYTQGHSLKIHFRRHLSKLNTVDIHDSKIISVAFADKSAPMPVDRLQTVLINVNQSGSAETKTDNHITAPSSDALQITSREINRDQDTPINTDNKAHILNKTNQNFIVCSEFKQSDMESTFPKRVQVNLNKCSSVLSKTNENIICSSSKRIQQQKVNDFHGNKTISVETARPALSGLLHKAIAECSINNTLINVDSSINSVDDGEHNSNREALDRKDGNLPSNVVFESDVLENQDPSELNLSLTKGQILAIIDAKGQKIVGNDLIEIIRTITQNSTKQSGNLNLRFEQGVVMQTEISSVSGTNTSVPEQQGTAKSSSDVISQTYLSESGNHSNLGLGNEFGECDNLTEK